MLLDLLFGGGNIENVFQNLLSFLLLLPLLLISLSIHEYAHGYAAFKQGDGYAKSMGRLSFNPIKHIDPMGLLCMIFVGFGWAKPVPVVPSNFRNGRKSMIIVASAGIIANLILAFIATFLYNFVYYVVYAQLALSVVGETVVFSLITALFYLARCNITLAVFNFMPIPPLDGYNIFKEIFIGKISYKAFADYERFSRMIMIIFLLVSYRVGIISFVSDGIFKGMNYLMDFIFIAFK